MKWRHYREVSWGFKRFWAMKTQYWASLVIKDWFSHSWGCLLWWTLLDHSVSYFIVSSAVSIICSDVICIVYFSRCPDSWTPQYSSYNYSQTVGLEDWRSKEYLPSLVGCHIKSAWMWLVGSKHIQWCECFYLLLILRLCLLTFFVPLKTPTLKHNHENFISERTHDTN
jgi:hypothetical protein